MKPSFQTPSALDRLESHACAGLLSDVGGAGRFRTSSLEARQGLWDLVCFPFPVAGGQTQGESYSTGEWVYSQKHNLHESAGVLRDAKRAPTPRW